MPVSEREAVKAQLAAQDERKNHQEDPHFNRAKSTHARLLTLTTTHERHTERRSPVVGGWAVGLMRFALCLSVRVRVCVMCVRLLSRLCHRGADPDPERRAGQQSERGGHSEGAAEGRQRDAGVHSVSPG